MKVIRMTRINTDGGKTAAFFDIQTPDGITIKGFRLVSGTNGLFISPPSDKGKDGKFYDNVILPKNLKEELEKMAIDEFQKTES